MISVLVPSKGRPAEYKRLLQSVKDTSSNAKVWLGVSEADKENYDGLAHMLVPEWLPTAHKWELLAQHAYVTSDSKLFMLGADDTIFATPLWDKAILDHYNALDNKIHVYSLRDSRDKTGTPHPIVTREYIEAMGYFLPPIFLHWFVDSWTVEIAKANNCFTHMDDYLLIHDKPSDKLPGMWDGDETRNGIRRHGWLNRDDYVNRTCPHFLTAEKQRLNSYFSRPISTDFMQPQDYLEATQ